MEPLFQIQNESRRRNIAQAYRAVKRPVPVLVLLCVAAVLFCAGFAFGVWKTNVTLAAVCGTGFLLSVGTLLFSSEFSWRGAARRAKQKSEPPAVTVRIFPDRIETQSETGAATLLTKTLRSAAETRDLFLLNVNGEQTLILPKRGFTFGTEEDFRSFLEDTLDLDIRRRRPLPLWPRLILALLAVAALAGLCFGVDALFGESLATPGDIPAFSTTAPETTTAPPLSAANLPPATTAPPATDAPTAANALTVTTATTAATP